LQEDLPVVSFVNAEYLMISTRRSAAVWLPRHGCPCGWASCRRSTCCSVSRPQCNSALRLLMSWTVKCYEAQL